MMIEKTVVAHITFLKTLIWTYFLLVLRPKRALWHYREKLLYILVFSAFDAENWKWLENSGSCGDLNGESVVKKSFFSKKWEMSTKPSTEKISRAIPRFLPIFYS